MRTLRNRRQAWEIVNLLAPFGCEEVDPTQLSWRVVTLGGVVKK
jgi:hypothetical protein